MFGKRITLFTVFGFTIRLDLSWLLLAGLVTWSMAEGFRQEPANFPVGTSWAMGVAVALGLFVSIVLHELTHSVVARMHGMRMKGITLFLLGGVAEMEDEPPTPWAEFGMAIVGPIASVVIAAMLGGGWWLSRAADGPASVTSVLATLGTMNIVLAVFNMVPAFPLDGGRVLRSILWGIKGNQRWATRIASILGVGFGAFLVAVGLVFVFVWPRAWQGITWVMIGLFLVVAARMPLRQLAVRQALAGLTVRRFMQPDPIVVPRWIPLSELVEDFVYKHQEKAFPVVDASGLVGFITIDHLKNVPRDAWANRTVGEVATPMPMAAMIGADEAADEALARMGKTGLPRLFVIDDGRLAGSVRIADLIAFIRLRDEIEGR